jgi:acetyl esterase
LSQYPSSAENNWILIDLHNNRGAMAYGIQAFRDRNPLAWSAFATAEDVAGFPPAVITSMSVIRYETKVSASTDS